MDKNLLEEIVLKNMDMVKQPYSELIKEVGFEATCAFLDKFEGESVYVPSMERLFLGCMAKQIKREYNGDNMRELSKTYKISQRSIRRILKGDSR